MLDVLLCYGFAANMIRAGYLDLVADLFRQIWAAWRGFNQIMMAVVRRSSRTARLTSAAATKSCFDGCRG